MTITTPGSKAYRSFRGLGSMKSGKLRDTVPAFLGGGVAAGTAIGLRSVWRPIGDDGKPSLLYRYAPIAGAVAGAGLGGLGSYFLAGKGPGGTSAALGSILTSLLVGGALWANDLQLAGMSAAQHNDHMVALGSPTVVATTPSPATGQPAGLRRVSMMHVDPVTGRPLGEVVATMGPGGGREPALRRVGNVNENAYGAHPYGG